MNQELKITFNKFNKNLAKNAVQSIGMVKNPDGTTSKILVTQLEEGASYDLASIDDSTNPISAQKIVMEQSVEIVKAFISAMNENNTEISEKWIEPRMVPAKSEVQKIETLSNPNHKKEAAFVIFLTEEKVWKNYQGISKLDAETKIPLVFMINRWDGLLGFPGGKVEENETLQQAAVRETYEEIGVVISEEELIPFASHEFSIVSHCFVVKRTYQEMLEIYRSVMQSPHFGSEIAGGFLAQLYDYGKNKGITNLLNSKLAKSVKEEIEDLVKELPSLLHE